jgi:hypothetical protein
MATAARKPQRAPVGEVRFDTRLKSFCVHELGGRVARGCQPKSYWCALGNGSRAAGKARVSQFLWMLKEDGSHQLGAVGMVPPQKHGLEDWLGWQNESVAVWNDGTRRQNGVRLANVGKAEAGKPLLYLLEYVPEGDLNDTRKGDRLGSLTVWRNGHVQCTFAGIPASWRFAAGGFGGSVRLLKEGEDPGQAMPRIAISSITAFHLPDGDMGEARSDAFVQIELVNDQGSGPGRKQVVQTETMANAEETCAWDDTLVMQLPASFETGRLIITVWDDDLDEDDALGVAELAITAAEGTIEIDKLEMKGCPQPGAAGYTFPDFELSLKFEFLNLF